jgi:hypothetical protein
MNKQLLFSLLKWQKSYVRDGELAIILHDKTDDAKAALIKRACHEKFLLRLRRGLYLIPLNNEKNPIDLFEVAQILYGPSYISFESSLSFHGWIPEAVYSVTSATTLRSKNMTTSLANFVYTKVPTSEFYLEVALQKSAKTQYFMASPWRALADLIFIQQKKYDNIADLFEDLRIDYDTIKSSNIESLKILCRNYPNQRTRKILQKFLRELTYGQ